MKTGLPKKKVEIELKKKIINGINIIYLTNKLKDGAILIKFLQDKKYFSIN